MTSSRRRLLQVAGMLAGGAALGVVWLRRRFDPRTPLGYPFPDASASGAALTPTPACGDPDATASQVEGPFYTPDTPLRTDLRERASAGTPLVITGRVVYTDCRPVAGAVLDFWSCDGNGVYDNDGYNLRGHQFTDPDGAFRVETVKPGAYSQFGFRRTPHVHVKVQGRDTALLTTQLYFPGEPLNSQDSQYDESLVMAVEGSADRSLRASFRFVLAAEARA
jgi:protocatechuate 3,4-dioxygenase beta subunit